MSISIIIVKHFTSKCAQVAFTERGGSLFEGLTELNYLVGIYAYVKHIHTKKLMGTGMELIHRE